MTYITVLVENTSLNKNIKAEHGLSIYIENEYEKILFDTGATDAFADNAEKLGINLASVDAAVISHGHYDHGGGIKKFLEINDHAPVYLSCNAFEDYYNNEYKYIGLDKKLIDCNRIVMVRDYMKIGEKSAIISHRNLKDIFPTKSYGLLKKENGKFIDDDFMHEQYLIVKDGGKKILFNGCAHRNIFNIICNLKPDIFFGGFHFMKIEVVNEKNEELDLAADILGSLDTVYYTGHCTGIKQYEYLKKKMGKQINYISGGSTIKI